MEVIIFAVYWVKQNVSSVLISPISFYFFNVATRKVLITYVA